MEKQLKKTVRQLKNDIKSNTYQRTKHVGDSEKYEKSDKQLVDDLKLLFLLPARPDLYIFFIKEWKGLEVLVGLLSHQNNEVVFSVVELLFELCDSDIVNLSDEYELIFDELITMGIIERLSSLIDKLNARGEKESSCIKNCLYVIDSFKSVAPETIDVISEKTNILSFLLEYIQLYQKPFCNIELYNFCCEFLSTLLLESIFVEKFVPKNENERMEKSKKFETLLEAIFQYKDKPPVKPEELESFGNLMNCIYSLNLHDENKKTFNKINGIEFLQKMIRELKFSRKFCIKSLDCALLNSKENCMRFIQSKGLKTYFGLFMKMKKKGYDESLISILTSLIKNIDDESMVKRIIKKFSEKDFQKTLKTFELFVKYDMNMENFAKKLESGEYQKEFEKSSSVTFQEELDDWLFLKKMENGLIIVQQVSVIFCFISQDPQIKEALLKMLEKANKTTEHVCGYIDEYSQIINDTDESKWFESLKQILC